MQSINLDFSFNVPRKVIYEALTDPMYIFILLVKASNAIHQSQGINEK